MKKILAVLLALCVVGGMAFAQITINGYERVITTIGSDGSASLANRLRLNLSYNDPDGNFGFWGRVQYGDFSTAPALAYGYGWAKLLDGKVKITAGKLGFYDYDPIWAGVSDTQLDNLFTDGLWGDGAVGLVAQVYPIDGAHFDVSFIPSGTVSLGDFGVHANYSLGDLGGIYVSSLFSDTIADSYASLFADIKPVEGVEAAVGYMYNGYAGYQAIKNGCQTVFAIINYSKDGIGANVSPAYDFKGGKGLYVEGYVGYTAGAFTLNVLGAYDQKGGVLGDGASDASYALDTTTGLVKTTAAKAAVPKTYMVGLEANYAVGKANLMAGCYYFDVSGLSFPIVVKVSF